METKEKIMDEKHLRSSWTVLVAVSTGAAEPH